MNLGLRCPLLLTYICWVIDAIREEKQAHQAQCYLEEDILEGAQHQQLKLFPEVGRGLGTWTHKPPTPRRPSSSLTGLLGSAIIDINMVKWMGTSEEARVLRALGTLLLASHSPSDQNAAFEQELSFDPNLIN